MTGSLEELECVVRRRVHSFPDQRMPLDGHRHAAVCCVLERTAPAQLSFLLTRRAARLRRHAGQWALPGGRLDAGETPSVAALRELREELGIELPPAAVLGTLDDYATRSGYLMTPVVVWGGEDLELRPAAGEVAAAYRVELSQLERPDVPRLSTIPESTRPVLSLPLMGDWVHAPTAAIIYQLFELLVRERIVRVRDYEQPVFAWR